MLTVRHNQKTAPKWLVIFDVILIYSKNREKNAKVKNLDDVMCVETNIWRSERRADVQ